MAINYNTITRVLSPRHASISLFSLHPRSSHIFYNISRDHKHLIQNSYTTDSTFLHKSRLKLEREPMPNMMVALLNIGGALCSMQQSLADAHCWSTVQ